MPWREAFFAGIFMPVLESPPRTLTHILEERRAQTGPLLLSGDGHNLQFLPRVVDLVQIPTRQT